MYLSCLTPSLNSNQGKIPLLKKRSNGFKNLMPANIAEALTPQELEALVDYLLTLE